MISKADVMHKAWQLFRKARTTFADWQLARREDGTFAGCLRMAWRIVKEAVAHIAAEAIRDAATKGPHCSEILGLQAELAALQFKSFRYNIAVERRAIEARLTALVHA